MADFPAVFKESEHRPVSLHHLPFRTIIMVPQRYGEPDRVEMLALDDRGVLWHRFTDRAGGWTPWERDNQPTTTD